MWNINTVLTSDKVLTIQFLQYTCIGTTHTHTTILRLCGICPGQPGWASTRRNIHPLTLIVVINHPNLLSPSTTKPWHPPYSIHVLYSLFPQSLSKLSLVYLLAWYPPPPLHTPYISSPNHCLLFAAQHRHNSIINVFCDGSFYARQYYGFLQG